MGFSLYRWLRHRGLYKSLLISCHQSEAGWGEEGGIGAVSPFRFHRADTSSVGGDVLGSEPRCRPGPGT